MYRKWRSREIPSPLSLAAIPESVPLDFLSARAPSLSGPRGPRVTQSKQVVRCRIFETARLSPWLERTKLLRTPGRDRVVLPNVFCVVFLAWRLRGRGGAPAPGGGVAAMGLDLDRCIEQLRQCEPLKESEVKQLCQLVRAPRVSANVRFLRQRAPPAEMPDRFAGAGASRQSSLHVDVGVGRHGAARTPSWPGQHCHPLDVGYLPRSVHLASPCLRGLRDSWWALLLSAVTGSFCLHAGPRDPCGGGQRAARRRARFRARA